ncbi:MULTISPECIES: DUF502 domain-containing protein [unclassified Siphonobacter]|uniref:DUF502 domain-containing protein n=1 Tax=unclassified Siphonobacter TaxID=2635712 RepID=UPI000CBD7EB3|nr:MULTISPECIES: DUF502 domain-containing protein [unclassified Siphonobacter]MDQ1089366.1 putative membrane protein [Siphonobacter sp. SORGH_AS_1065]MDR6195539.1 putative membrane protein [Siphonobacter sp. SORGH_AS_0500]PKK35351.1 hypothetical protein BWI96_17660 [Siphonobacter sp. SORGH_AS_0500]
MKKRILNRFINYFIRGLLLIAPLFFTGYILYQAFLYLDGLIPVGIGTGKEQIRLWGVGMVIVLAIVFLVGFLGSTFILIPIFNVFEEIIDRLPLVRIIYSSLKDLTSAFVGDKKKFNQPVLVKMDAHSELYRIGFLTQTDLTDWELPGSVAVYFPQSYAFSGHLFIVPKENVKPVNVSATEVMKFIVSGGVTLH